MDGHSRRDLGRPAREGDGLRENVWGEAYLSGRALHVRARPPLYVQLRARKRDAGRHRTRGVLRFLQAGKLIAHEAEPLLLRQRLFARERRDLVVGQRTVKDAEFIELDGVRWRIHSPEVLEVESKLEEVDGE